MMIAVDVEADVKAAASELRCKYLRRYPLVTLPYTVAVAAAMKATATDLRCNK